MKNNLKILYLNIFVGAKDEKRRKIGRNLHLQGAAKRDRVQQCRAAQSAEKIQQRQRDSATDSHALRLRKRQQIEYIIFLLSWWLRQGSKSLTDDFEYWFKFI